MYYLLIFCLVSLPFYPNSAFAQNHYKVDWYTDAEGMPQNSVNSIFKDKYGFVWFSTENGLARFDGKNFKVFDEETIKGLSANRMGNFFGHPGKDSVFTTNNQRSGELLLINGRKVEKIPDSTTTLLSDIKPVNHTAGLAHYQTMFGGHPYFYGDTPLDISRYFAAKDTRFVLTEDSIREISRRSKSKKITYVYEDSTAGHYFLKNKAFYNITCDGKMSRFKNGKETKIKADPTLLKDARVYVNAIANQVFLYKDGTLYLINRIKKDGLDKKTLVENFKYNPSDISAILYDQTNGYIYFGTANKGFGLIKILPFTSIKAKEEDADNIVYGMAKLDDSTLITGTGAVIRNNKIIARNDFRLLSDKYYLAYLKNHRSLWTFNLHHLYQLKEQKDYQFKQVDQFKISNDKEYSLLHKKNDDTLWIAISNRKHDQGTLYARWVSGPETEREKIAETPFRITSLIEINQDSLYLGSKDGGLYLLKDYRNKPVLKKMDGKLNVRGFFKDRSHFWVTTYDQGYYLIKNSNLISFPIDKSHYLKTVHAIRADKEGYFWIATNNGLFRASRKNLYNYARNQDGEVYYQYYDKNYGFSTNEFNGGGYPNAVILSENFYFPSLDGVVRFSPADLDRKTKETGIFIDHINTDGETHGTWNNLELKSDFDRLTVTAAYPFYGSPKNLETEAKLQNGQAVQDWTPLNSDGSISYTNLAPGEYSLKVRKRSHLNPHYREDKVHFSITPLFWQTAWFELIVILLGLAIILALLYLRLKYFAKQRKMLQKEVYLRTMDLNKTVEQLAATEKELRAELSFQKSIIGSISHDLQTPTKYLTLVSKQFYENEETYGRARKKNMGLIYETSNKINGFLDNLLVYAKSSIDELDKTRHRVFLRDIVEDCVLFFKISLHEKNSAFENHIDPGLSVYSNEQILKIIIQNILDNAMKHTADGKITLYCFENKTDLILHIEDDGSGIDEERLALFREFFRSKDTRGPKKLETPGLGFKIIKRLLPYINAEIRINSVKDTRTTFKVIIPKETEGALPENQT